LIVGQKAVSEPEGTSALRKIFRGSDGRHGNPALFHPAKPGRGKPSGKGGFDDTIPVGS
jgi:hypothetical protein